jgi:hypothetical protein
MANRMLYLIGLLVVATSAFAQDRPPPPKSGTRTFYDAMGRTTGTAQTHNNVTTFRDSMGRTTGTAERLPDGRTEYRDAQGRLIGPSQ